MKNSSINTNIRSVKVFFNWLVEQEYISANPFTKVKDLKTSKRKPEYLENEEVLSMIKACKNIQDKTIVAVLVSTGLRRNELVNIKLEDIHGDAIKIIGKGDKERVVYMQDDVFNLYQEYLIWREKNNKRKGITSEYLFVTKMNDKFSGDSIYLKIKSIARNAGLSEDRVEKIHPHMFRHTFATNLRESSGDIRIVQHSLGHSKLETTMIYDDVRDVSLRTAMLKQKAIV
jgi:integrase/recombinase XerD